MVNFVTGTSDLDISGRLCGEILSLLKNQSSNHIVYIVPEQFEYESERKIYKLLEKNRLLSMSEKVEVTTFSALSHEILDLCSDNRPIADDIVKNVVIHKAINECSQDLKALGGICKKPGFSQKILSTIDGFKANGLSANRLSASLNDINKSENELSKKTLLMNKLSDVSLLYSEYSGNMTNYLDAPDVTALAATGLVKCGILYEADVIVDCFNDFTSGQTQFIQQMITAANSVMFGFTTDYDSENDVFKSANDNINAICRFADIEGIKTNFVCDNIPLRIPQSSPLSELSVKLFTSEKSTVPAGESIELISAADIHEELDFVCSKIIALADEKKYRYRDIAVLCTDLGSYGRHIENSFKKYNIPIFLDMHESILNQPLVNTVISTLNAVENFSVDTVVSCLKTGFFSKIDPDNENERVGLSDYDINTFEDYIFEWAITTKHLFAPFSFPIGGSGANTDYKRETAETVRREAAIPLFEFSEKIPKSGIDGAKLTEMLYNFLMENVGVKRALTARTIKGKTDGDNSLFDQECIALYRRLWNALIKIFNTLHRELDGVEITIRDYTDMFRDLCSNTTLSSPPQMVDRVLVGDIDRTRADGVKAVFIVGATYDLFPTNFSQTGIFSQYEAELICTSISQIEDVGGIEIFKSAREQFSLAKYRAYKALTLPTDYLCVTAPEMGADGEGAERSEVTLELTRLFTDNDKRLTFKNAAAYTNKPDTRNSCSAECEESEFVTEKCFTNEFYCRSKQSAKSRFALNLGKDPFADAVLREALIRNNDGEFVRKLEEIHSEHKDDFIGKHTITRDRACLLFPTTISATDIEKLCGCPFSFFTGKGLNIREKKSRKFNSSMRGEAIHFVLEEILREYSGDIDELCKLSRAEFLEMSIRHLKEYCNRETNGDFAEDERSRFLFNNIAHSASDVLISMQAELFARGYRPKFFELDLPKSPRTLPVPNDPAKPTVPPPPAELFSNNSAPVNSVPKASTQSNDSITTAPFVINVDSSLSVIVTGRIDRLDMYTVGTGADKKTYIRMVDYKSSAHSFSLSHAIHGLNVQMLLYMVALVDANRNNPINVAAGELSYIPSKSSGASSEATTPFRLLAGSHLGSNMFVEDEKINSDLENYKRFIREKIAFEDGKAALMTADPDALSDEEKKERDEYEKSLDSLLSSLNRNEENTIEDKDYDILKDILTEKLSERLNSLFNGDVSASPVAADARTSPCGYCNLKSICKNGGKPANVIPKGEWKKCFDEKKGEK